MGATWGGGGTYTTPYIVGIGLAKLSPSEYPSFGGETKCLGRIPQKGRPMAAPAVLFLCSWSGYKGGTIWRLQFTSALLWCSHCDF